MHPYRYIYLHATYLAKVSGTIWFMQKLQYVYSSRIYLINTTTVKIEIQISFRTDTQKVHKILFRWQRYVLP